MLDLFGLFAVIGIPTLIATALNEVEYRRSADSIESRKERSGTSCPPHKWIFVAYNSELDSILTCEMCGYRNSFNN
jgi:hypothetical protein